MILLLAIFALVLGFVLLITYSFAADANVGFDWVIGTVGAFFILASILLFIFGIVLQSFVGFDQKIEVERTEIVSLERGSTVGGSFALGFGSVNGKSVYYAYRQINENSYELIEFSAKENIIIEDSSVVPVLIKYELQPENSFLAWATIPKSGGSEVYVPEGTITKVFQP